VEISYSGNFAVITELVGQRVRMIDLVTSQVTTLAGSGNNAFADGQGTQASFSAPEGVAISRDDSFVLVVEGYQSTSHRVRRIVIATGFVTTLAGNGAGSDDGVGTLAKFNGPRGIALSPDGSYALITDSLNYRVRRLDMVSNAVTTVAGLTQGFADGTGTNAQFNQFMFQLAIDPTGAYALISDHSNHRIRRLAIASTQVTTLAGSGATGFQDGVGTNAVFNRTRGVSIDPTGAYALILDGDNHRIRRILIATSQVTTLAGTGAASAVDGAGAQAAFNQPTGICIDASGTFALVADFGNNRIRHIALASPPCSAGFYCPSGSSSAAQLTCSSGTYCPAGSSSATVCPVSAFCSSSALANYTLCTQGSYCAVAGLSAPNGTCAGGHYCGSGSSTATQNLCMNGTYCPQGSNQSTLCPVSAFCASNGMVNYAPCTDGFYCNTTGLSAVSGSCLLGTYCPARSTAASLCAPGYFCASGSVFSVRGAIDGQGVDIFCVFFLLVSPSCI
jgi:DNA-binding beta-propeller fold protein YncE